jgi:hypothetical protein
LRKEIIDNKVLLTPLALKIAWESLGLAAAA